jgi:hypothetical protein
MRLVLRIKALLLRQKPLSDDEIWLCYMEAARHMKPTPMFARDFARLVEAKHGIVSRHEVRGFDPVNNRET